MSLIREYRIPLPISVEEYKIAQLYAVAEASKNETGGGEGIEVVENVPYDIQGEEFGKDVTGTCQYTFKIMHLQSKVPGIIRALAPEGSLEVHEKAWNAYPYCKTIYTNPYMGKNFHVIIQTWHKEGHSDQHRNVHGLKGRELEKREFIDLDIVNDDVASYDYKDDEDPKKYRSDKAKRGPLAQDWNQKNDDNEALSKEGYPMMTCYKLYNVKFQWWGLQTVVQGKIIEAVTRLLRNFHRQMFCWMDRWFGMTMEDIRALEDKTQVELKQMRHEGEVKGMRVK